MTRKDTRYGPSRGATDSSDLVQCVVDLRVLRQELVADTPASPKRDKHQTALKALEQQTLALFMARRARATGSARVTIAVVGDFSSGKSTFINAMLGHDLCPVKVEPSTSSVTYFSHGGRLFIERETENGREELTPNRYRDLVCHKKSGPSNPHTFHIETPSAHLTHLRLIDTPGFNNPRNPHDTAVTHAAVANADALFVVMDISKGNPTAALLKQLEALRKASRTGEREIPAFLIINQADKLSPAGRRKVRAKNEKKYGHLFRAVLVVSSLQLAEHAAAEVTELLEAHLKRTLNAILSREPFKVQLSGGPPVSGVSTYEVELDGAKHKLSPRSATDLSTRADLVQLLATLRAERRELLVARDIREHKELREAWRETLKGLLGHLRALKREKTTHNKGSDKRLVKTLDDTLQKLTGLFEEVFTDARMGVFTQSQRVEEGFIFDTTHYQIFIWPDKVTNYVSKNAVWNHVLKDLMRLAEDMKSEYGITFKFPHKKLKKGVMKGMTTCASKIREVFDMSATQRSTVQEWTDEDERSAAWYEYMQNSRDISVQLAEELTEKVYGPTLNELRDTVYLVLGQTIQAAKHQVGEVEDLLRRTKTLLKEVP